VATSVETASEVIKVFMRPIVACHFHNPAHNTIRRLILSDLKRAFWCIYGISHPSEAAPKKTVRRDIFHYVYAVLYHPEYLHDVIRFVFAVGIIQELAPLESAVVK
jgi:hypothetical protein